MILITGATGTVGRPLVAGLAATGHPVRALTRAPRAAHFPAGVESCDSAHPDLDGVTAVFVNPAALWRGEQALLDAVEAAGVTRVVTLSSSSVLSGDSHHAVANRHRELEAAAESVAPEFVHLRPDAFAANARQWIGQVKAGDTVVGPYAGAVTAPVHEDDIAAVAVRALTGAIPSGETPVLTGPQALSFTEQVRILGAALGRPLRYEEISHSAARAAMLSSPWMTEEIADSLLRYFASCVETPTAVSPDLERILGRRGHAFEDWAADRIAEFR
ncbi:NAD(P)H-binding protein [Streptomyces sp. NBC_01089]|uniref:NAD(P)H-binding protein n=1 Tax=Streptomyces sp. NBC_01089 TaxID=2903747 RepID=UPI00386823B9|nr:NAD(P)H-binding protein [Streptomyces sp. NBC_01089]